MDHLVTFGKHRGHTIEELVADTGYMAWLESLPDWEERWEARVIAAVRNGTSVPAQPKKRLILEQEYDFAVERPAKVRKVTHRKYCNKAVNFECPNCGANDAKELLFGGKIPTRLLCKICGQHATIKIEQVLGNRWTVLIEAYDCPNWSGKQVEDYERACAACPKKKGVYADHTACGCWKEFECTCK